MIKDFWDYVFVVVVMAALYGMMYLSCLACVAIWGWGV